MRPEDAIWQILGPYALTLPKVFNVKVEDEIFAILPTQGFSKGYGLRYRRHGFEASESDNMS